MTGGSDRDRRIDRIFEQALELDVSERDSFLSVECVSDPSLRRDVEELLRHADAPGGFLDPGGSLINSARRRATRGPPGAPRDFVRLSAGDSVSHYRLDQPIGQGGMGVVWRATDAILGRTVAIKVLPEEAALDGRRRTMFLREARIASSIKDSSVAQVYEFARDGDLEFIVMELVDGESLAQRLKAGPMGVATLVKIALQTARALGRAHRKGLIHRDLKPSNILLTPDGDVKLVDFGLAKLFETEDIPAMEPRASLPPGRLGHTTVRGGTPPYMSPEQIRGEELDRRTDIYSLGVVLYEMATGRTPFTARTSAELFETILEGRPVDPRTLRPGLPPPLVEAIDKALAPQAGERHQSMEELADDLTRVARTAIPALETSPAERRRRLGVVTGIGLVIVMAAWMAASGRLGAPAAPPAPTTILVAPLEVRGPDGKDDYVGRAFAEAVAVNLAQKGALEVLAVPEGDAWRALSPEDRRQRALARGAGSLVTGTLVRERGASRIDLTLHDTARQRILWGEQRNVPDGTLPAAAGALAAAVSRRLGVPGSARYEYFLYLTGGPEMAKSPELAAALGAIRRLDVGSWEATERLVNAYPDETDAHVLNMVAHFLASWALPAGSDEKRQYERAVAKVRSLDPDNPWDDHLEAMFKVRAGKVGEAIDDLSRILERDDLTPAAKANLHSLRSVYLSAVGDKQAALQDINEALRLNPTDDVSLGILAAGLLNLGRKDEALVRARQAVALNPGNSQNQLSLGECLLALQRWERAPEPLGKACELRPEQHYCGLYAYALLRAGREEEAARAERFAVGLEETDWGALALASYQALKRKRQPTLDYLRKAGELAQSPDLVRDHVEQNEEFDWLRDDPDLIALLN